MTLEPYTLYLCGFIYKKRAKDTHGGSVK